MIVLYSAFLKSGKGMHPSPLLSLLLLLLILFPTALAHGGDEKEGDRNNEDPSSSATTNLHEKGLLLVKIWCLIIILVSTFACGISPYFMRWNDAFLVLGTQFAGGVFLGTALMHFLSDSDATFRSLTDKDYPFAFMLASLGYIITLLGDCFVQWLFDIHTPTSNTTHSDAEIGSIASPISKTESDGKVMSMIGDKCTRCGKASGNCSCVGGDTRNIVKASLITMTSFSDSILLIIALCFHSVFEGIAIGVAETKDDAWKALWTVCLHKIFAAIAMGIALLRMLPSRPLLSCMAYSFSFAISSPVGIAIGIVIDATTEGLVADWVFAISMGIACGVFVYVAINHLLAKGYAPQTKAPMVSSLLFKFLAVMGGVGVIAVVMIWDT